MHNRQHRHSTSYYTSTKQVHEMSVIVIVFVACIFFTRVLSGVFEKVLTAVKVLVCTHGGHLGVGDVLERGEEQNHFSFFILNWDDVEQAPKWSTCKFYTFRGSKVRFRDFAWIFIISEGGMSAKKGLAVT